MVKRKNPHPLRDHFSLSINKNTLKCNRCDRVYKTNTSITNLKQHFKKFHNDEYELIIKEYSSKIKSNKNNQERSNQVKSNKIELDSSENRSVVIETFGKVNYQIIGGDVNYDISTKKIKIIFE
ncbi:MAG TPA: hypothetical protein VIY08_00810 [Candidatus Nitrosocosmicus sp.]